MDDDKARKGRVGTPVPGCPIIPSYREAHLFFIKTNPKTQNRKHIFTDFSERMCFLALFLQKSGFELFTVQSKGFPAYFSASSTAAATKWVCWPWDCCLLHSENQTFSPVSTTGSSTASAAGSIVGSATGSAADSSAVVSTAEVSSSIGGSE